MIVIMIICIAGQYITLEIFCSFMMTVVFWQVLGLWIPGRVGGERMEGAESFNIYLQGSKQQISLMSVAPSRYRNNRKHTFQEQKASLLYLKIYYICDINIQKIYYSLLLNKASILP